MTLYPKLKRTQKFVEIEYELERAEKKHPDFPKNMFQQLAIMQEEAGEVTKAVLDYYSGDGSIDDVRDELIQTAAFV